MADKTPVKLIVTTPTGAVTITAATDCAIEDKGLYVFRNGVEIAVFKLWSHFIWEKPA